MCLGDIRFMPYLRFQDRGTLTTSATATKQIPRNPQRVGLVIGFAGNDVYMWPGEVSPGSTTGMYLDNTGGNAESWIFKYQTWGEIIMGAWWVATGVAGTIRWGEVIAPEDIIAYIRNIKLGPNAPSGFPAS